jgi:hypothetical protein
MGWRRGRAEQVQPDPAAEAEWTFRLIEDARREAFYSHQMLALAGRPRHRPAATPEPAIVLELRYRLRQFLVSPVVAGPINGWGWQGRQYYGVEIADPFRDGRPTRLEDTPNFSPEHPISERFVAFDGLLLDGQTEQWHAAPGLDLWLLGVIRDSFPELLDRLTKSEQRHLLKGVPAATPSPRATGK